MKRSVKSKREHDAVFGDRDTKHTEQWVKDMVAGRISRRPALAAEDTLSSQID